MTIAFQVLTGVILLNLMVLEHSYSTLASVPSAKCTSGSLLLQMSILATTTNSKILLGVCVMDCLHSYIHFNTCMVYLLLFYYHPAS
ncbi:hypothetical protein BDW60DRAFT_180835 [Aspergillus nidulans var. acristatus]